MNKATKGALAAAAGAAILAGGAGTMAAWSGSSPLGGGEVTAGALDITQTGQGSWHWNTADGAAFNPDSDQLVPGDTVVYVGKYLITAKGTNLKATLTPSLGNVSGDLLPYLTTAPLNGAPTQITTGDDQTTKVIGTSITFDPNTADKNGQRMKATLADASIVLTQNTPTS